MEENSNKNSELSLEEALMAFRRRLFDIMHKEAKNFDYSISQIEALQYIAEKKNPSMKDISSYLKITPPSVTTLIEGMIDKDLVKRVMNQSDRRTIQITLTSKAKNLFKIIHTRKTLIFKKMFSKLSENDRKQLVRIIRILIKD